MTKLFLGLPSFLPSAVLSFCHSGYKGHPFYSTRERYWEKLRVSTLCHWLITHFLTFVPSSKNAFEPWYLELNCLKLPAVWNSGHFSLDKNYTISAIYYQLTQSYFCFRGECELERLTCTHHHFLLSTSQVSCMYLTYAFTAVAIKYWVYITRTLIG